MFLFHAFFLMVAFLWQENYVVLGGKNRALTFIYVVIFKAFNVLALTLVPCVHGEPNVL